MMCWFAVFVKTQSLSLLRSAVMVLDLNWNWTESNYHLTACFFIGNVWKTRNDISEWTHCQEWKKLTNFMEVSKIVP